MQFPYKKPLLTISILVAMQAAWANEDTSEVLPTITVNATENKPATPNVVKKKREQIQTEMISTTQDLVRYTTDVGISDNGRHFKGFAMRGVDGNRVGMSIDGVALPDYEENSLYSRYGNLNQSRLNIDPELTTSIELVRGSDSFNSGSGALGGSVNYRTLENKDIISDDKNWGVYLKNGYASKNDEWTHTAAAAYDNGKFDGLVATTYRHGNELESLGSGQDLIGNNARGIPDPAEHENQSYLAKVGYRFSDAHRISASYNQQDNHNYTDEKSYNGFGWRESEDIGKRKNANLAYEFTPETGVLSRLKVGADWQEAIIGVINHKGPYTYSSPKTKRAEDERQDRSSTTDFKHLGLSLDFNPLDTKLGSHNFSVRVGYSEKEMEMLLKDFYHLSGKWTEPTVSTIQNPTNTKNYYFSVLDKIQWNDIFSTDLGLKYNHYKLTPLPLNARCNACSTDVKEQKFDGVTGQFGINAQLNDAWKVGYQLSTGFRIPSATELYFSYNHAAGTWRPNPNLKEEKSLTHNLSIEGKGDIGDTRLSVYHTRYKDFLHEEESMEIEPSGRRQLYQTMTNVDRAEVTGVEFEGKLNLGHFFNVNKGLSFVGGLGYSKGKMSNGADLLSLQPLKLITGLDYVDPNNKWGIFYRLSHHRGKRANDATYTQQTAECTGGETTVMEIDPWYGFEVPRTVCGGWESVTKHVTYPWLNKSYTTMDLFGFYNITKNATLRAGIYNITDKKYHTWDALRGTNAQNRSGTTNTIDRAGLGLERYLAPGRNITVSMEFKF